MKTTHPNRFLSYKFRFAKQADKIIEKAINTLGEDRRFITWMVCANSELDFPIERNDLKGIDVLKWFRATEFLGLPADSFQFGYCQTIHTRSLFDKIKIGRYLFPRGRKYQVLLRKMKRAKNLDLQFKKTYYGKRLYLKARYYEISDQLKNLPIYLYNTLDSRITLFFSRIAYHRILAWNSSSSSQILNLYTEATRRNLKEESDSMILTED